MATRIASTNSGLLTALKAASSGDVISLTGGTYSAVIKDIHKTVTITTSGNAVFSHLEVVKSSGLTFNGIDFNAPDGSTKPFEVRSSDNIMIRGGDMEGVASGTGTGRGLWVGDSTNFRLKDMTIHGFDTGIYAGGVDGLTIRSNRMTNISTDGLIAGDISDAWISGNTIDLATPSGRKHSDGIQLWNNAPNAPSTDLIIEDNTIRTHNNQSHGIYMANAVANSGGGSSSFFQNVTIQHNVIVSGDGFGISWGQTNHLDIHENIVIKDPALLPEKSVPSIRVAWQSTDVELSHNVVEKKSVPADAAWQEATRTGSNWEVTDRIIPVGSSLDAARAALTALQAAPQAAAAAKAAPAAETNSADADVFHFNARIGAIDTATGVDFGAGDTIVLHDYAKGTFSGAFASADGTSVTIDSLADLKAIDKGSSALKIHERSGDTIALVIHQETGDHGVRLIGLAHDYF